MRRTLWTALALTVLLAGVLTAQTADEEYLKAMQISDNCQKVQALGAYITKYAGQDGQYDKYAYAYYCVTPCSSKDAAKAIQYGEKALAGGGLDDQMRIAIVATIAELHASQGQLDQAKAAAQRLVDLGKAMKDAALGKKVTAAGYELAGDFAVKAGDFGSAADNYITAYGVGKDPKTAAKVQSLGKRLYDQKKFAEAIKVYQALYASAQDTESAKILAQAYYKAGDIDKALATYKEAYAKKKSGDLAYNIAVILANKAKTNSSLNPEAMNYFIEAGLLNPSESKKCLGIAQNLFLGDNKDLKASYAKIEEHQKVIEQLTKNFNDKYGDKTEDDLTPAEKVTVRKLKDAIQDEQDAIARIQAQQKGFIDKFNALVTQVRSRLGR